jgi:hypothetical protein
MFIFFKDYPEPVIRFSLLFCLLPNASAQARVTGERDTSRQKTYAVTRRLQRNVRLGSWVTDAYIQA